METLASSPGCMKKRLSSYGLGTLLHSYLLNPSPFHLIGQHACVRVINNFFSINDLEYFTIPQGESEWAIYMID